MDFIKQLDIQLFLVLNGLHNDAIDPIMALISGRNTWIPLYALIIGWMIWKHKKQSIWMLLMIIAAIAISDQAASGLLKPLVARLRPCHEPTIQHLVHLVGNCGGQYGFCSSHAANTFSLAMSLFLLFGQKIKAVVWFFVWAAVVSYSRIYLGVHYPIDVLVGALLGILASWICYKVYLRFTD
ncbi:undecaprenyl-diphosphatase [Pseudarcicella hirudinis]|uniref:Undecaprenyl-diphosphatase n=1 Tax=Pseudarcicella hirudinis TaxID=1079859 RepID=A0A1I5YR57_9BACT|nr:phosphatase PAP2 family protein [Pseudarcicella hirudinis]SFQ46764.1 undecaprenyl-diphosphatase [Pseudarcicella hirudinis]